MQISNQYLKATCLFRSVCLAFFLNFIDLIHHNWQRGEGSPEYIQLFNLEYYTTEKKQAHQVSQIWEKRVPAIYSINNTRPQ